MGLPVAVLPGAAGVERALIRRPRRRCRAQSGSRTPNPAPDSSGPASRTNFHAPAVSRLTAAGAAVRSSASSSGNSRDARPSPVSSSSSG